MIIEDRWKNEKIFGLILLGLLVLVGCKAKDNVDEVSRVTNYLSGLSSYSLTSKMTIQRADKNVSVNVEVDYLSPSYYKVCLKGIVTSLSLRMIQVFM